MGKKHAVKQGPAEVPAPMTVATGPWTELLAVCRKCGRKLKRRGFGPAGRDDLPEALKHRLRETRRRRAVRVIEVGCLGVCPKGGVTVLRGDAPGEMLVVPAGTEIDQLVARLGLAPPAEGA